MTAAPEPRRLTPTERLHEVTMAALLRRAAEPESSVTIARNARGVYQLEVTVRGPIVEECCARGVALVEDLILSYPYPAGPTNGGETT